MPPLRNSAAFAHHRSSAGSCAPRPDGLGGERRREPRPAGVLPHVHGLGPRSGRADQRPHAVAELVALLLADRAPVRGHVLHVVGAVVPDDVDELVDVDAVVHGRSSSRRGSASSCHTLPSGSRPRRGEHSRGDRSISSDPGGRRRSRPARAARARRDRVRGRASRLRTTSPATISKRSSSAICCGFSRIRVSLRLAAATHPSVRVSAPRRRTPARCRTASCRTSSVRSSAAASPRQRSIDSTG